MWWDNNGKRCVKDGKQQLPPAWIREKHRNVSTHGGLGERASMCIENELSRCLSLMKSERLPSSSAVWLTQGIDPVTGRSLAPLLNEETRIASGSDIRSSNIAAGASILQVNNTFTTIGYCPNPLLSSDRRKTINGENLNAEKKSHKVQGISKKHSKPSTKLHHIPLYPRCVGDIIRHWIIDCPSEGVNKALSKFTVSDRNSSDGGKPGYQKKLYSKRKTVALAFLHYCSVHSVALYELKFGKLSDNMVTVKTQKESSEYLNAIYQNDLSLKEGFKCEKFVRTFTEKIVRDLKLETLVTKISLQRMS